MNFKDFSVQRNYSAALQQSLKTLPSPALVYDLDQVSANYQQLIKEIKVAKVYFAVKSCSYLPVLKELYKQGCGFEVNSIYEFDQVLKASGGKKVDVINSAPVKMESHIAYMYKNGVNTFAYDSEDELDKIRRNAPGAMVYIRIHTKNIGSGQALNTKYGVSYQEAPDLLVKAVEMGLTPVGVTFTVGSQCNNLDNWEDGIKKSAKLFKFFPTLKILNVGGGIPISYQEESIGLNLINKTIQSSIKKYFTEKPDIWIEPGRYLVGNTAFAKSKIIGVRKNHSGNWIFIDISKFGMFIETFEFAEGDLLYTICWETDSPLVKHHVGGPTCDGADILYKNIRLPVDLKRDDYIYILNLGAYTLEYGSDFNGYKRPSTYYIQKGKIAKF